MYSIFDVSNLWLWWLIFTAIVYFYAEKKNRSPWRWVGISLLISPFLSLVFLFFMKEGDYQNQKESNDKQFKCEKCNAINKWDNKYCSDCGAKVVE